MNRVRSDRVQSTMGVNASTVQCAPKLIGCASATHVTYQSGLQLNVVQPFDMHAVCYSVSL